MSGKLGFALSEFEIVMNLFQTGCRWKSQADASVCIGTWPSKQCVKAIDAEASAQFICNLAFKTPGFKQDRPNQRGHVPRQCRERFRRRELRRPLLQASSNCRSKSPGFVCRDVNKPFPDGCESSPVGRGRSAKTLVQGVQQHGQIGLTGVARTDEDGQRPHVHTCLRDRPEVLDVDLVVARHDSAHAHRRCMSLDRPPAAGR